MKECKQCGSEFETHDRRRKHCSPGCSLRGKQISDKNAVLRYLVKNKEKRKVYGREYRNKNTEEINRRRRELHAIHAKDPEYRAHLAKQSRISYSKLKDDPSYMEKRRISNKKSYEKRRANKGVIKSCKNCNACFPWSVDRQLYCSPECREEFKKNPEKIAEHKLYAKFDEYYKHKSAEWRAQYKNDPAFMEKFRNIVK